MREKPVGVPELYSAAVRNAMQGASVRAGAIGNERFLPDNENSEIGISVSGQDLLGCRGPLQTFPSSGREQEQESSAGRGVEQLLKAGQIHVG